ncbi:rolling circle replication-associated protein [Alkalispirillum mobile]|nr:hypothetical protein [Alkalispirillum mobile]
MKQAVITSARLHCETLPSGFRAAMVTLTYAHDDQWSPRHISELIKRARQWLKRRRLRLRYTWVLELTRRGRPHYHIMLWLPRRVRLPKPDKAGWWPHGLTRIEWARNAVGYLAKYASKDIEGALPKGARIHGNGGLNDAARAERAWWLCPAYVRERCEPADLPRRCPGGGWWLKGTGEWFPSAWRLLGFEGGTVVIVPREMAA